MITDTKTKELIIEMEVKGEASSNLPAVKIDFLAMVAKQKTDLVTEDDFLEAAENIKTYTSLQGAIKKAMADAVNGAATIKKQTDLGNELLTMVAEVKKNLVAQVKANKESIRANLISEASTAISKHEKDLIETLMLSEYTSLTTIGPEIEESLKNKKTDDSRKLALNSVIESAQLRNKTRLNLMASNVALVKAQVFDIFKDVRWLISLETVELVSEINFRNSKENERLELLKKEEQEKAEAKAKKELEEKQEAERLENERIAQETRAFEEAEAKRLEAEEAKAVVKENFTTETPLKTDQNHFRDTKEMVNPDSAEIAPTENPNQLGCYNCAYGPTIEECSCGKACIKNNAWETAEDKPFTQDDLQEPSEDHVNHHERLNKELPEWMNESTVKENLTVEWVQEYQLTFKASNEDAKAIQSTIQKIYMGTNPILTLANQQG